MEIKIGQGIDKILFGMKAAHVKTLLGEPDKQLELEDKIEFAYNKQKMRVSFYFDEEDRCAYMETANPNATLFGQKIIGAPIEQVIEHLKTNGIDDWEKDDYESFESYINDENWILLNTEYGCVTDIEIGALINEDEDFLWAFE